MVATSLTCFTAVERAQEPIKFAIISHLWTQTLNVVMGSIELEVVLRSLPSRNYYFLIHKSLESGNLVWIEECVYVRMGPTCV